MKIISGKTVFASLVFLLIMSFVVNNFLNEDNFSRDKDKYKRSSENQDKIIGVEIRQQNKQGDKFLIIADTLEEIKSKEKKVILENSLTINSDKNLLPPIILVGLTALSDDINIIFLTLVFNAALQIDLVVNKLFLKPSKGLISTTPTCLYAAAWKIRLTL